MWGSFKQKQSCEHVQHLDTEISQPLAGFTLLTSEQTKMQCLDQTCSTHTCVFYTWKVQCSINSVYCILVETTDKSKQSKTSVTGVYDYFLSYSSSSNIKNHLYSLSTNRLGNKRKQAQNYELSWKTYLQKMQNCLYHIQSIP